MKKIAYFLGFWAFITHLQAQTSSNLVYLNNGSLKYTKYAMTDTTNAESVIPDFSFAGYGKGGVSLPTVSTVLTISPVTGDNTSHIQDAIDSVSSLTPDANGYRGAVFLEAGIYVVGDTIRIDSSGVVLRGAGQAENGTILIDTARTQHTLIVVSGDESKGFKEDTSTTERIITPYVPVGTYKFRVADVSGFSIGDTISVARTPNWDWINDIGMDSTTLCAGAGGGGSSSPPEITGPASSFVDHWGNPIVQDCTPIEDESSGSSSGCRGWTPESYRIKYLREIVDIQGDTIFIDMPIVDVMETRYGGGEVSKATYLGAIKESGVEHLRIKSAYCGDNDEDHLWTAIRLLLAENCWVKNVTAQYIGYACVSISNSSRFNTVQDCAAKDFRSIITGGRRYSFTIKSGVGNLIQRCYTSGGRHDFETGSRVTGPNVFLDCYSDDTNSDIGPHHRYSTGILFDNIRGGQIRVRNRGSSGTGHGWVGNQIIFWNLKSYKSDIWVDSPTGGKNFGIGCEASTFLGSGYWEHQNQHVTPRSLFLQQLEDRLGDSAVENITIPEQLDGDIYEMLSIWQGEDSIPRVFALADAYVRGGTNDSTNYGGSTKLEVKTNSSNATYERFAFLKFDLSPYAGTKLPTSAKLRIYVDNIVDNDSSGVTHRLHEISDDSWKEDSIIYADKPTRGAAIDSVDLLAEGNWVEFDVSGFVLQEMEGDQIISFEIVDKTNNHYASYYSSDHSNTSLHPEIVFSYDTQPTLLEDAHVRSGTYADSTLNWTKLVIKDAGGNNERRSFLKFDLSSFSPSNPPIVATLRMYMNNGDGAGVSHKLYEAGSDSWSESTITYNNKPITGAVIDSVDLPSTDGEWVEYDITGTVLEELSGDKILSLELAESSYNHYVSYYSSEASQTDKHPEIVFSYETTVSVLEDAYVNAGSKADDTHDKTTLVVKNGSGSGLRESYLKFDLSGFSDENAPTSAKLRLYMNNGDGAGVTHSLYMAGNDTWSESTITYNNQPTMGAFIDSVSLPSTDGEWVEFDVTDEVSQEMSGDETLSLEIVEASSNHYVSYYSSEHSSSNLPYLDLTFGGSPAPRKARPVVAVPTLEETRPSWYPNPVSDMLKSSFDFKAGSKIEVLSLMGKRMLQKELNGSQHQINLSQLPRGNYIVRTIYDGKMAIQKIVKY